MKKNLLLSFIITVFSFICFLLFMLETYYLANQVNEFIFLTIAFMVSFIFSMLTVFITKKIFKDKKFYREFSISFLIIMVSFLITNTLEMILVKTFVDVSSNNILYFLASILQTLRLTFGFSIPIYVLVNVLEFARSKMFKEENYESV